jgi:S-adenosylmethionine:tRNA ribosyltransferase-isomerase
VSAIELATLQEAHEPPEARGLARDSVRLLVADVADGSVVHGSFRDLPDFLTPGDLVVVNTSATLAAALPAVRQDGAELELRLSTPMEGNDPERFWIVELRSGELPFGGIEVRDVLSLPGGGSAEILAPYAGVRLWLAHLDLPAPLGEYLDGHGSPIRYRYVPRSWPLSLYQNVYAVEPGSAEMPSAGRPFTTELITRLVAGGVLVAPIVLHTGVSSQERHERPYAERYRVPAATADLVNAVHALGGRVIATGTTVVRALETVADADGHLEAGEGWTNVIVTPERGVRAVDGLITGLHELESSHLDMLRALAGEHLVMKAYDAALEQGYRWHEFGDSQLILGAHGTAASCA